MSLIEIWNTAFEEQQEQVPEGDDTVTGTGDPQDPPAVTGEVDPEIIQDAENMGELNTELGEDAGLNTHLSEFSQEITEADEGLNIVAPALDDLSGQLEQAGKEGDGIDQNTAAMLKTATEAIHLLAGMNYRTQVIRGRKFPGYNTPAFEEYDKRPNKTVSDKRKIALEASAEMDERSGSVLQAIINFILSIPKRVGEWIGKFFDFADRAKKRAETVSAAAKKASPVQGKIETGKFAKRLVLANEKLPTPSEVLSVYNKYLTDNNGVSKIFLSTDTMMNIGETLAKAMSGDVVTFDQMLGAYSKLEFGEKKQGEVEGTIECTYMMPFGGYQAKLTMPTKDGYMNNKNVSDLQKFTLKQVQGGEIPQEMDRLSPQDCAKLADTIVQHMKVYDSFKQELNKIKDISNKIAEAIKKTSIRADHENKKENGPVQENKDLRDGAQKTGDWFKTFTAKLIYGAFSDLVINASKQIRTYDIHTAGALLDYAAASLKGTGQAAAVKTSGSREVVPA